MLPPVPSFVFFVRLHVVGESFERALFFFFLSLVEHLIFGISRSIVVRDDDADNEAKQKIRHERQNAILFVG